MEEDLNDYSPDDRKRIEGRAKRNLSSEAVLILTTGFSLVMLVMSAKASLTFLPIAEAVGVRPLLVLAVFSFVIAAIWAGLHVLYWRPKVARARLLSAAFVYEQQNRRKLELAEKMKAICETQ